MELRTTTLREGPRLLTVEGEMDLYNADEFKKAVSILLADGSESIVIDLSELTYIDSSGIGALLFTVTQARAKNLPVCFVGVTGSVRTVIELTSLLGFLPIENTIADAVNRFGT